MRRAWNWILCLVYGRCPETLWRGGHAQFVCALHSRHFAYHETNDGDSWCYDVDGEPVVASGVWAR